MGKHPVVCHRPRREEIAERLDRALAHGARGSLEELENAVARGHAQWWESDGGVLVTQVTPGGVKELHVWVAAGRMQSVLDLADRAEEWARTIGCHVMTATGRKGWARALRDRRWVAATRRSLDGLTELAKVI